MTYHSPDADRRQEIARNDELQIPAGYRPGVEPPDYESGLPVPSDINMPGLLSAKQRHVRTLRETYLGLVNRAKRGRRSPDSVPKSPSKQVREKRQELRGLEGLSVEDLI